MAAAVRANYPTLLRDAGVEGTATARFAGADGVPERSSIEAVSSTHPDFGRAWRRRCALPPAHWAARPCACT